ncbi:MAG: molybdopterin oxidoreductase family protein [Pseudomonadota bacterium]
MSSAAAETTIVRRACNLCEAICGLRFHLREGEIVKIESDPDDPLSQGHICPKAVALQDYQQDPDRLRQPARRIGRGDGATWETIGWDKALDLAADGIVDVVRRHGVDALGVYFGNPSVHNYGMLTHQKALFGHLKTRNRYSATSVDQLPHHLVSLWLYGHKDMLPVPDIDRADYMLMLGANPMASNGSIWTVPGIPKRIKALKARGGKLVVIDPRRTETAAVASEWHAIRPGTDALFLLSLLQVMFDEGLADPGHLTEFVDGLDEIAAVVGPFGPERVAGFTGVSAEAIRTIARNLAGAEHGICYGRMGLSVQRFGALNTWLTQIINIATGNLDREGGMMFPLPAVDTIANGNPGGFDRARSRVRGLPEFTRELPVAALAEEILTPGEGQVRALFTGAGNPVLSTPNGRQLDTALESLEFMVSLDPYLNETTRHADVILPPTTPLEHDHYDLAFHTLAIRNTARMSEPVMPKPADARDDWEIFNGLGERVAERLGVAPRTLPPPRRIVDQGLRFGPYGQSHELSLEKLAEHPSGIDLGPMRSMLPERLFTGDKRIPCAQPRMLDDIDRAREVLDADVDNDRLLLIGRRHVRSNNSWMHNYHRLVKGKPRNTLLIHPEDAVRRGLANGARAQVASRVGAVEAVVEFSDAMMPGVVSLPHGFGHDRSGVRLGTATQHAGASCNDLTDEAEVDPVSGNAVLNGVPVAVSAAG